MPGGFLAGILPDPGQAVTCDHGLKAPVQHDERWGGPPRPAHDQSPNPDPRKTLNRHDAKVAKDTVYRCIQRRP